MSFPPQGGGSADPGRSPGESGTVTAGDAAVVTIFNLTDGETLEVTRATLILADGQAAPAGIDLIIATLDNNGGGTKQSELIAGDGSVQVDVEGSPLSSYTNETGGPQTVAIMVDNGNFGAGTGSNQDVQSNYTGAVS